MCFAWWKVLIIALAGSGMLQISCKPNGSATQEPLAVEKHSTSKPSILASASAPGLAASVSGSPALPLPDSTRVSAASTVEQKGAGRVIWEGTSGGVRIHWTEADITAESEHVGNNAHFSALTMARRDYQREFEEDPEMKDNPSWLEDRLSVLSIVGTLVSLEHRITYELARAAHPGGETRYSSVDLSTLGPTPEPPKEDSLTGHFPAPAVFEALRKDSVVQKALRSAAAESPENRRPPADLDALVKRLGTVELDEPCAVFPENMLSRFAVHHREKSAVAIRIGLPGCGTSRYNLTMLGFAFPTPDSLSESLAAAETRSQGFLMKDAAAIAKGRKTVLKFGSRDAVQRARGGPPPED